MQVVTAPEDGLLAAQQPSTKSLFLAGGISGCPDWQAELIPMLADLPLVLFNPRRASFDMDDPAQAREQIAWEVRYLRAADAILFWFPAESVCPITLLELGRWASSGKRVFVGCHPQYPRRFDVTEQLMHYNSRIRIVDTLGALAAQVQSCQRTVFEF